MIAPAGIPSTQRIPLIALDGLHFTNALPTVLAARTLRI